MIRIAAKDSVDIATLVAKHRALDERVRRLDKRPYLSPAEQLELRRLKKMRLATKDLIADLRMRRAAS